MPERNEMLVAYSDRNLNVVIARIRRDPDGICFELVSRHISDTPFAKGQLECFIRRLIEKPLKVSRMRHAAFPDLFDELEPDSEEHFENIFKSFGPFRVMEMSARQH